MIGRIRGRLLEKHLTDIQVDVNGVGYELHVPMSTLYRLPETGQSVDLHTHMVVREDSHALYGFYSVQEKQLFRSLIKVSGVGPKLGLAILSGMAVDDFVRTVNLNDVAALTRMPGVGKKTAERLIIEMRDRLAEWGHGESPATGLPAGGSASSLAREAEAAMVSLGYKPAEASKVVAMALKNTPDVADSESLIRLALKSMA